MDMLSRGEKIVFAGAIVMVAAPAVLVLGQNIAHRVKTSRFIPTCIKSTPTVLLTNHS